MGVTKLLQKSKRQKKICRCLRFFILFFTCFLTVRVTSPFSCVAFCFYTNGRADLPRSTHLPQREAPPISARNDLRQCTRPPRTKSRKLPNGCNRWNLSERPLMPAHPQVREAIYSYNSKCRSPSERLQTGIRRPKCQCHSSFPPKGNTTYPAITWMHNKQP